MAADYAIWYQPVVGEVDFDDLKLFVGPIGLNDPVASNEFAVLVLQSHTNNQAERVELRKRMKIKNEQIKDQYIFFLPIAMENTSSSDIVFEPQSAYLANDSKACANTIKSDDRLC